MGEISFANSYIHLPERCYSLQAQCLLRNRELCVPMMSWPGNWASTLPGWARRKALL